jgi:cytoskeleton protein RodZ
MAPVGAYLRELRVKRGLSLDELARVTRVASRYLDALENDSFGALPAPVFTRGFIRAYCQAVGVTPDEALARFDGREAPEAPPLVATASRMVTAPVTQGSSEGEPRTRSAILVSFVLLVVLGVALFAVALVTQPAREDRAERRPAAPLAAPVAPASPAARVAPAPPVAAITPSPPDVATRPIPPPGFKPPLPRPADQVRPAPPSVAAPPSSIAPVAPPPAAAPQPMPPSGPRSWVPDVQSATSGLSTPYRLVARVTEPTWIRVRTEDGRTSEETVPSGAVREWVSNRPFVITIGNAGGVSFELNGRSLPSFGASGTVISGVVLPPEGGRPR